MSASVVDSIIGAVYEPGGILEIGPGPGVLTQRLQNLAPLVALDIDPRVETLLSESAPKAKFIKADVLKCDLRALIEPLAPPRWVVSNLPYNISSAVLVRLCEVRGLLTGCVLMMQREVAERITAKPGNSDRGSLSVAVQLRYTIKSICKVPATAFYPPPKVESTVLSFTPKLAAVPSEIDRLLRAGFTQPRKTLINNLGSLMKRESAEKLLTRCGLDSRIRAHALTEAQWIDLATHLNSLSN